MDRIVDILLGNIYNRTDERFRGWNGKSWSEGRSNYIYSGEFLYADDILGEIIPLPVVVFPLIRRLD